MRKQVWKVSHLLVSHTKFHIWLQGQCLYRGYGASDLQLPDARDMPLLLYRQYRSGVCSCYSLPTLNLPFSDLSLLSFVLLKKRSEGASLKVATMTYAGSGAFLCAIKPILPSSIHPMRHICGLLSQKANWRAEAQWLKLGISLTLRARSRPCQSARIRQSCTQTN